MQVNDDQFENLFSFFGYNGIAFFDATQYDSYTSGPCALGSLKEIEDDLKNTAEWTIKPK